MVACHNLENEGAVDIDHTTLDQIDSIDCVVYSERKKERKNVYNAVLRLTPAPPFVDGLSQLKTQNVSKIYGLV